MRRFVALLLVAAGSILAARGGEVPQQVNYQGRVTVDGAAFAGTGQFKFAIVDGAGAVSYWSNDGTSVGGNPPGGTVPLNVASGVFTVRLGDCSYAGMTVPLGPSVFASEDRWLRVWFSRGGAAFERIMPDCKLTAVPYALKAETVPDASIDGRKLARESVWPEHSGRGNSIVSLFGTVGPVGGSATTYLDLDRSTTATVDPVPEGETFIITDALLGSLKDSASFTEGWQVGYHDATKTQETILFSVSWMDTILRFQAGLPVPSGCFVYARQWSAGHSSITISGFLVPE